MDAVSVSRYFSRIEEDFRDPDIPLQEIANNDPELDFELRIVGFSHCCSYWMLIFDKQVDRCTVFYVHRKKRCRTFSDHDSIDSKD